MPEVFGSSFEGRALLDSLLARRGRMRALRQAIWPLVPRHEHPECYDKQFRRYRREIRFPTAAYVWALGEGLRRCGIGWMRGTIMLFAYGLHEDLVGVYATAGDDLVPFKTWFLHEVLNLPIIAGYSALDPVLQPADEYELLRFNARAVRALFSKHKIPLRSKALSDEALFLGMRQMTRIALADPPREYVALLNSAWRRWRRETDDVFTEDEFDFYDTVRSNNIPPERRAKRLGEQLSDWFRILEAANRPSQGDNAESKITDDAASKTTDEAASKTADEAASNATDEAPSNTTDEAESDATDDAASDTTDDADSGGLGNANENPVDPFTAVSKEVERLRMSSRRRRVQCCDSARDIFAVKPGIVYPRRKYDIFKSR